MKKTLFVLASLLICLSLVLGACGKSDEKTAESGTKEETPKTDTDAPKTEETPAPASKVTIKMFAPQLASIENMETNLFTKHLEEKTNVHIQWDLVPNDALNERKQLMLASGDYPEVILHGDLTKEEQMKYGQQGVFIPLNDLIEKYAPNVKKAMAEIPYLKGAMTAPDGNIYAIPQVNECFHCTYAQKYWINKKWLDDLGLQMPTTTDELYTVLKAFKEKDPNHNGQADEIPLTGATYENMWMGNIDGYLMNAFIYNDSDSFLIVRDGKVDLAANKPEWKQGLEYIRKLYKEGLIDPASFTQNADAIAQLANKEPDNVMGSITTALISYAYPVDDKHPRHKDFVTVPPVKGPNGYQAAGYFAGVSKSQFAITNKASEEQQIAAMKMVDYLYTEEAILLEEKGPEGGGWRKAKDGEKDFHGNQAKYAVIVNPNAESKPTHNDGWEQIGPSVRTAAYRESWATPQDPLAEGAYETRLWQESKKYEPFATKEAYPSSVFMNAEDADDAAQLKTTIKDYIKQNMAQFITGNKDIEKDWDAYVQGFEGLQLQRYIEIYQKALGSN